MGIHSKMKIQVKCTKTYLKEFPSIVERNSYILEEEFANTINAEEMVIDYTDINGDNIHFKIKGIWWTFSSGSNHSSGVFSISKSNVLKENSNVLTTEI
jgi:hypothetical protein